MYFIFLGNFGGKSKFLCLIDCEFFEGSYMVFRYYVFGVYVRTEYRRYSGVFENKGKFRWGLVCVVGGLVFFSRRLF